MGEILLALAKASIVVGLGLSTNFDLPKARKDYPILNKNGAVFVTLREDKKLRGCIGSLVAHKPLYKDIIINAHLSAFKDKRFKPLKKEELSKISIEVSILSKPKKVEFKTINELKNKIGKKDGVILKLKNNQATYLPTVWSVLPKFEDFFSALCKKASLNKKAYLKTSCLKDKPTIYIYQVTKYITPPR